MGSPWPQRRTFWRSWSSLPICCGMSSTQVNAFILPFICIYMQVLNLSWTFHEFNEIVSVTGKSNVSEVLPTGQLSNIPWRRAGVKYTNNEAYFDVIEEVRKLLVCIICKYSLFPSRWMQSLTSRGVQCLPRSTDTLTAQWSLLACPTLPWALSTQGSLMMSPSTPVFGKYHCIASLYPPQSAERPIQVQEMGEWSNSLICSSRWQLQAGLLSHWKRKCGEWRQMLHFMCIGYLALCR